MEEKEKNIAFLKSFTIFIFILLASIDNAAADMAPSVYWAMEGGLHTEEFLLGIVTAITTWIIAGSAVFWGFLGDKGNRKKLLLIGTAIWVSSLICTPLVKNILSWLIVDIIAGIGLGCIASVGFSVIVDFIKPKKRGLAMSWWGVSQGIGTVVGKGLAALIVKKESEWWLPFFWISIAGIGLIIAYFFTVDPGRGATEEELKDVNYDYTIKLNDLKTILKKPTNLALLFQGLTAQVVWGSITWLPYVITKIVFYQGITDDEAGGLIGNIIAGLLGVGGAFSILFGDLGDRLQKKTMKARPIISTVGVLTGIPLFMLMLMVPFDISSMAGTTGTMDIIFGLLNQLGTNPMFLLMFLFAIGAAAMMAADSPNWFALIGDVNLPEHRGTVFGLGNFINGIGRGIGAGSFGLIAQSFLTYFPEPANYIWALIVLQLFFIPAGVCYLAACFYIERDFNHVRQTLKRRADKIKEETHASD
ncbi:MAG: MFS transporter [Candidatus Hodarchaeota archaeon]